MHILSKKAAWDTESLCDRDNQLTFIIHLPIAINVGLSNHLINFLVCQLLTEVSHDVTQFSCTDVAVSVLGVGEDKSEPIAIITKIKNTFFFFLPKIK